MISNSRTIINSGGTELISPPKTECEEVRVIISDGTKSVLVVVDVAPSSPVKIHHGETSAMIIRAIARSFIPTNVFLFHTINAIEKATSNAPRYVTMVCKEEPCEVTISSTLLPLISMSCLAISPLSAVIFISYVPGGTETSATPLVFILALGPIPSLSSEISPSSIKAP